MIFSMLTRPRERRSTSDMEASCPTVVMPVLTRVLCVGCVNIRVSMRSAECFSRAWASASAFRLFLAAIRTSQSSTVPAITFLKAGPRFSSSSRGILPVSIAILSLMSRTPLSASCMARVAVIPPICSPTALYTGLLSGVLLGVGAKEPCVCREAGRGVTCNTDPSLLGSSYSRSNRICLMTRRACT